MTLYTGPTAADLARIPAELAALPQWLLWRGVDKIDKQTGEITGLDKVPYHPQSLHKASVSNPDSLYTLDYCMMALAGALEGWQLEDPAAYRGGGIGFVFTEQDDFFGFDTDKCRDPQTGEIEPQALAYLQRLGTYTEVSQSRTGLHAIGRGKLPPGGRRKGRVELYDAGRFFVMTGWHLPGMPVTTQPRQDALSTLHADVFGSPQPAQASSPAPASSPTLDDTALLARARKAKNSAKFQALWDGDTSLHDGDDSRADESLCVELAFWTQEPAQIDRLFRQSGLMRPKWDEQHGAQTYGQLTIEKALAYQTRHYSPGQEPARLIVGLGTPTQQVPSCPDIILNTELPRMVDETQAALHVLPSAPVIYQRTRHLVIVARGMKPPKWLHRPQDMPVIIDASAARLTELASQAAHYWKWDKRGKKWELALPSKLIVETLCSRTAWPFPVLEGIIASPTLRPDGSVLDAPGYDADTGLYLDTNGTAFPPLLAHPTLDDARSAIGALQEAVKDFPFAKQWHWSTAYAAVLSLVCRFTIMGNVPLFAIRANTRGSGKSLLADVVSIIGTGCAAPRWPQVKEDEEERKRLLTVALAGYPCLHIDNVARPLGSPALDMALTAASFSDRLLGKNESREAPLHMVWLASGNNMAFQGDTARRVVPIDLDPKMERPEERTGFVHDPLIPWLQQERPRLTVAALTIVKAYFEADCPSQKLTPMGSFEQWSDLIRQALIWAGEADPNAGRKDLEAESNPEYEQLAVLLEAWSTCYPIPQGRKRSVPKTLKEVLDDIAALKLMDKPRLDPKKPNTPNEYDALQDALGALYEDYDGKGLRSKTIGYKLRAMQGRVIGAKRLVIMGKDRTITSMWGLEAL